MPRVIALYGLHELRDKKLITQVETVNLSSRLPTGASYTYKTLALQVPWSQQIAVARKASTTLALKFTVDSSRQASLIVFEREPLYAGLTGNDVEVATFINIEPPTNYETYRQVITINPSDVNLLTSPSIFLPKLSLLMLKSSTVPIGDGVVRAFENAYGVRGFKTGISATSTAIELFTPLDQQYSLLVSNATNGEIDQILQSLKEI